jgi:hypothetical protein
MRGLDKSLELRFDKERFRMRRALASLLLALFSFPLMQPMLRADTASNLPACCRRKGEHRCAMPEQSTADQVSNSLQAKCPSYPKAGIVAFSFDSVLLTAPIGSSAPVAIRFAALTAGHSVLSIALRDSVHKRGPPSLA